MRTRGRFLPSYEQATPPPLPIKSGFEPDFHCRSGLCRGTSNMTDARIRQARPEDSASWLRLRRFLWPRCSEQKHDLEMGQLLKSGGTVFLVENEQGQPIGFAEVSLRHDHVDGASICPVPYLEAWFVEAAFRCKVFGRALMDAVEAWASSRGYTVLASDAEIGNDLRIRLH